MTRRFLYSVPLLYGAVFLASIIVLWLFWFPLFPSLSIFDPKEVQPISLALGQVLIGYFAALLGGYFLAIQVSSDRLDWYGVQLQELAKNTSSATTGRDVITARIESFEFFGVPVRQKILQGVASLPQLSPIAVQSKVSKSRIDERIIECKNASEAAENLLRVITTESAGLTKEFESDIAWALDQITQVRNQYLSEGYEFAKQRLQKRKGELNWRFEIASAACLSQAFLCFCPDVLLSQTLPRGLSLSRHVVPEGIPSGVILLFLAMVLLSTIGTARPFLRVFVQSVSRGETL
jgi:hypothetical protein